MNLAANLAVINARVDDLEARAGLARIASEASGKPIPDATRRRLILAHRQNVRHLRLALEAEQARARFEARQSP